MGKVRFIFYPDLPFFLARRESELEIGFESGQSIKHLVESLGIPHTEIGVVQVNGVEAQLENLARAGDRVEVYAATAKSGALPASIRFVLDNHLGKLAAYLRMLGLDTLYRNDYQDEELARVAGEQDRILLTRDRRLLMRRMVRYGYCPRSLDSDEQMLEVMTRFDLFDKVRPFERCLRCNGQLQAVGKETVLDRLQPLTKTYYDDFYICSNCEQVYWKGSHYERMLDKIETFRRGSKTWKL
jgi:uncharacterized protein